MRYTYDVHSISNRNRVATTTNIDEANAEVQQRFKQYTDHLIMVYDNMYALKEPVCRLHTLEEVYAFRDKLERDAAWKPDALATALNEAYKHAKAKEEIGLTLGKIEAEELEKDVRRQAQATPINPAHYQNYMSGMPLVSEMQWLEAQQYKPNFRNPTSFKAAVELQIRKYLDRLGGKDDEAQELSKSLWYLKFLIAYIKNGNKPIQFKDIPALLDK